MAAAAALFATGSALAIVQPGDIGDDESAAPAATTTSTTSPSTTTTEAAITTTVVVTTTTTAPGSTSTTLGGGETTTTVAGSGLGEGSAPNGGSRGVANTGGESMIGAGMALAALGLLLRRAVRPEAA